MADADARSARDAATDLGFAWSDLATLVGADTSALHEAGVAVRYPNGCSDAATERANGAPQGW